jgi:hypothetical protein
MQKRVRDIPVMYDLDTRFRIMEQDDGYTQVLTLNLPPIEIVAGPKESPDLAWSRSEHPALQGMRE